MTETLRFERRLAAPRALVFAALTQTALLRRWMCPEDFEVAEVEADAQVGGRFRLVMRGPDGALYPASGEYLEVRPPEAVVFTWAWETGHAMAGIEARISIELAEEAGGTRMVMIHSGLPDAAERDSHRDGWTSSLRQLDRLVTEERERWTG